jgi:hypothetical protein
MGTDPHSSARPFVIRDPVHGYLVVAAHERIVVDDPVTQRLRRINQTGLAEYVFPEARTSRIVHSLGAMHLASRFVLAALENAEEEVAIRFFDDIETRVSKYSGVGDSISELLQQDGTLSALATVRASFRHQKLRSFVQHGRIDHAGGRTLADRLSPFPGGTFEYPWQRLYAAAMVETDDSQLPKKIRDAEAIVLQRKAQLKDGATDDGDAEELVAIRDALSGLNILRRELDERHGFKRTEWQ